MRRVLSRRWGSLPATIAVFVTAAVAVAVGPFDGDTGTVGTWGSWASLVALAASALGLLSHFVVSRTEAAPPPDPDTRERLIRVTDEIWISGRLRGRLAVDHTIPARLTDAESLHDRRLHPRALPEHATIEAAFDLRREQILILGEAGVGKSTQALLLVSTLLGKARAELGPIPVVLPLATWGRHPDLLDWMAGQLGAYQVSAPRARSWLRSGVLLPVLDGLDEISDPTQRARCVDAINAFLVAHEGRPLIVCSRRTAYEELSGRFTGSLCPVLVRRPSAAQREAFLDALGDRGERIRAALISQPRLHDLLDTPLALTIAAKAFQDVDIAELRTADVSLGRLWETYLEATFVHPLGQPQPYAEDDARRWLDWVAWRSVTSGTGRFDLNALRGRELRWYLATILAASLVGVGSVYTVRWSSVWPALLLVGAFVVFYIPKNEASPGPAEHWVFRIFLVLMAVMAFIFPDEVPFVRAQRVVVGACVGIAGAVAIPLLARIRTRGDRDSSFRWFLCAGAFLFLPAILARVTYGELSEAVLTVTYSLLMTGLVGWDFVAVRVWKAAYRARAGNGPLRYRRFLVWATDQLWLVQVGEEFEAVHPTLLEHLAVNLETERFRPTGRELGTLAAFLTNAKRMTRAELIYERALAAAPRDPEVLGGYALFLQRLGRDPTRVRAAYEQALAVKRKSRSNLIRYADFLRWVEADFENAGQLYKRAIGADPKDRGLVHRYIGFLIDTGETDEAKRAYDRAIALAPDDPAVLCPFAVFLQEAGDPAAGEAYERALAADPDNADNLRNYSIYLHHVVGDLERAREMYERAAAVPPVDPKRLAPLATFLHDVVGDVDAARAVYTQLLAADPSDTALLRGFARFLESTDDAAGAARWYDEAVTAAPADPVVLGARAAFLHRAHDPSAEEAYERALAADPMNAHNLGNSGIYCQHVVGDPGRARALYERAAAAAPHSVDHLSRLVRFLNEVVEDSEAARQACLAAVERAPHDAAVVGYYARFLHQAGDPEAGHVYRRALELDPRHADNLYEFAKLLQAMGEHTEARRLYARAVGAAPQRVQVLHSYALFLDRDLGVPDLARPVYERALAVAPTDPQSVRLLAVHLQDNGDLDRAYEFYEQAVADGGAPADLLYGFGVLLWRNGDRRRAEEMYRRALALEPDNPYATVNLVELLCIENNTEEARERWAHFSSQPDLSPEAALDMWFLAAAFFPDRHDEALRHIDELVRTGTRSPGWEFDVSSRQLREEGSSAVAFLEALAEVISGKRDPAVLDAFPVWQETTGGPAPA